MVGMTLRKADGQASSRFRLVGPSRMEGVVGGSEKRPWRKLRDYFLQVSSCRSVEECMRAAVVEMQTIIPFDETAGIFDASNNFNYAGIGKSEACAAAYNSYYRTRRPPTHEPIIDWRNYDEEYVRDFLFPNGMYKALRCAVRGHATWIAVVRSRLSPGFSDDHVDTLALIEDYLHNLFSSFDKMRSPTDSALSAEGLARRFGFLTPREAEVCSLVASRLNTAEIAARLFISRRTVENHVARVFDKLDVRSREQLRFRLGVLPF
jgi:DNA-binding CsgD family transcriptional regulator